MSSVDKKKNDVVDNKEELPERYVDFYFSDFWRGFVKFWWVGVSLAILFGGAMFLKNYKSYTPQYSAQTTFTVHTQNATLSGDGGLSAYSFYYDRGTADQLANVFPYVLESEILQKKVCAELGVDSMPASVSASSVEGTNMIELKTTGSDPQLTYDVLVSVIENYSIVAEYIIGQTKIVTITPPEVPTEPSNQFSWRTDTIIGAFIGILLGVAWILIYGVLRRTIRTKDDIRRELNHRCIGILPQVFFKTYRKKVDLSILLTNPLVGSSFLESLRLLREAVSSSLESDEKVIMITSTAPGEGKSVVAANLSAMFAKNDIKVLLIDGDLRNSGISRLLEGKQQREKEIVKNDKGREIYKISSVDALKLDLMSFNVLPGQLKKTLRTADVHKVVNSLRDKYDLIFIDTPPSGMISDAGIIAGAADVAMYVIRQDMVMDTNIKQGIDNLLATDVRFLGCILNGTIGGIGGYGNNYGYGYGYSRYTRYSRYNKYYGRYGYGYGYGYGKNKRRKESK